MPVNGQYTTHKVSNPSHGETVAGVLLRPKNVPNPPADEGYAAFIFDPRSVGDRTGQLRRQENPKTKNEDTVAGLNYLESRGDIDKSKLFLVGVCQGGPESLDVASYDDRVIGAAFVTGYFRDRETDIYICAGCVSAEPGADISTMKMPTAEQGEALYQARLKRARKAKALYERIGEVIYQPLVDPNAADPDKGHLLDSQDL
ncbi:hypothetical protein EYZ11_012309 [Aspergillus tanneri]|uniref:Dienelactone hydrolase domain-containing protein n=1 Tax=Aspergillus tanneri TaxID=1220188 RepID=A0A4S3J5Y5_9EURO|nr:uncharacterized protein ATNIH1004_008636 [Aspergillus tanneri]KAA8644432.1 hypothetical protein ATNIH1004_008636 [Aspergillus tanneri]THC88241.1 hypothetical protein EYZ11_012309 [Aspergillus tanneri]